MNGAECSFRAFQSGDASAAARFPATPLELQQFVEFTGGVAGGRDARTSPDLSDPFLLARSTKHEKARVEDGRRLLMPRRGEKLLKAIRLPKNRTAVTTLLLLWRITKAANCLPSRSGESCIY